MNSQQLLGELAVMSHSQRMSRMVEVGRQSLGDPAVAEILAKMAHGGQFVRLLSLQACYGSRQFSRVRESLVDASRNVRGLALVLLPLVGDEEEVASAFATLPPHSRRTLLRNLKRRRRGAAIELCLRQIDPQREWALLAFGGSQWLDKVTFEQTRPDLWRRLVVGHPEAMADRLLALDFDPKDGHVVACLKEALLCLSDMLPDRALALLEAWLAKGVALQSLAWEPLFRRRPNQCLALVLPHLRWRPSPLDSVVHQLSEDNLKLCLGRGWLRGRPQAWLGRLDQERRRLCYAVSVAAWRGDLGIVDAQVVALLPHDLRVEEARRHLTLAPLQARPMERLPYCAFLEWEEALAQLQPTLGDPDPDLRASSLAALVGAARYAASSLDPLLEILVARKHEQDPVRCQFLAAVAELPPSRWTTRHFKSLGQLIRHAWEAGDASDSTMREIERLLLRILPHQPQWGAPWLVQLWKERGRVHSYSLATSLPPHLASYLQLELPALLQLWREREKHSCILQLARALGVRLKLFPEVQQHLQAICRDPRGHEASPAFDVIAQAAPEILPTLVPQLLAEDPSWVLHRSFCQYLHRYRQDLLTPYLGEHSCSGRFASGKVDRVLPLDGEFFRWTPEQQFLFASQLDRLTRDESQDSSVWLRAIARLSQLPSIPPKRLLELASLDEPRVVVREWAIRALARLDGGQGIDLLLQALSDERARFAIYALRSCLLEMPVERSLKILADAPLQKVTVAKEVVRLLGDLPAGAGLELLLERSEGITQRDVRVALLRALWPHLEDARCWPLVEAGAVDPDPAVAVSLTAIPAAHYTAETRLKLAQVLARILTHPDPRARTLALQRLHNFPDPEHSFLEPLKSCLGSADPGEVSSAAFLVIRLYGDQPKVISTLCQESLQRPRTLQALVRMVERGILFPKKSLTAVLKVLSKSPGTVPQRLALAARGLTLEEFLAKVEEELKADPVGWDVHLATRDCWTLLAPERATQDKVLARWQSSGDPRLRRIALEWLILAAARHGWLDPWREALKAFQADGEPLVCGLARFTFADA